MAEIGIDLGTTNSAVAVLRNVPQIIENQGYQITPSAVAWDGGEIIVGRAAKDQAADLGSVLSVKRHMGTDRRFRLGDREYSAVEVSAMILKDLKKAAEERLGEPADAAVITIPAYFSGAQKEATKEAGQQAGFQSVKLLAEPIAAALAYGAEETVLVYDLGGGTFDVAIIDCFDYTMISLDGDNYLGGDDFDDRLIAHLAKEIQKQQGVDIQSDALAKWKAKQECEKAKIDLSKKTQTTIRYMWPVAGKAVMMNLTVTREQFEQMIMEQIDRTIVKVEATIAKAREKEGSFSKEDIDTVLLVGGSTYIPLVERRLAEYFDKPPSKKVNPDLAVALGAAIATATGPAAAGVHRVRLEPLPEVTADKQLIIKGRTSPGSQLEVRGAATAASGQAGSDGKFSLTIDLFPDKINEVTVVATDANGEERKTGFHVRHDSSFTGEAKKPRKVAAVGAGLLPRTLGIRVHRQNDCLGVVMPGQTQLPASVVSRDYGIQSDVPNIPGMAQLEIYEGDIPCSLLNTHLATLTIQTPPSPNTQEPLEITFQVTEDHLLTATARMVNYPDRVVSTKVNCKSPSGTSLHVVESAERVLNLGGEKIRPEERARLNKAKQALLDLCEQYKTNPNPQSDCYQRIKETGLRLREDLQKAMVMYSIS